MHVEAKHPAYAYIPKVRGRSDTGEFLELICQSVYPVNASSLVRNPDLKNKVEKWLRWTVDNCVFSTRVCCHEITHGKLTTQDNKEAMYTLHSKFWAKNLLNRSQKDHKDGFFLLLLIW